MDNIIISGIKANYRSLFPVEFSAFDEAINDELKAKTSKALNNAIESHILNSIMKADNPAMRFINNCFAFAIVKGDKGIEIRDKARPFARMTVTLKTAEAVDAWDTLLTYTRIAFESSMNDSDTARATLNQAFDKLITFTRIALDESFTVKKQVLRFTIDTLKSWKGINPRAVGYKDIDYALVHALARATDNQSDVKAVFKRDVMKTIEAVPAEAVPAVPAVPAEAVPAEAVPAVPAVPAEAVPAEAVQAEAVPAVPAEAVKADKRKRK